MLALLVCLVVCGLPLLMDAHWSLSHCSFFGAHVYKNCCSSCHSSRHRHGGKETIFMPCCCCPDLFPLPEWFCPTGYLIIWEVWRMCGSHLAVFKVDSWLWAWGFFPCSTCRSICSARDQIGIPCVLPNTLIPNYLPPTLPLKHLQRNFPLFQQSNELIYNLYLPNNLLFHMPAKGLAGWLFFNS